MHDRVQARAIQQHQCPRRLHVLAVRVASLAEMQTGVQIVVAEAVVKTQRLETGFGVRRSCASSIIRHSRHGVDGFPCYALLIAPIAA
jgi:hypothetical protein